jgi:ubiquinone/menaquinone biosynthesis C-methylase UbiE
MRNADQATVDGFGDEWSRFDQSRLSEAESRQAFEDYFRIFPWSTLPDAAVGFDLGCGSGRWARRVAPRVGTLHCIDASPAALRVAEKNLGDRPNCVFHRASVSDMPLPDDSMDFGYSLGVLHHIPDPREGLRACVKKLKRGGPFLVYLYYAFDNRPAWFRGIWRVSDLGRRVVSRLPKPLRFGVSEILAATIYLPMARTAKLLERAGVDVEQFPLASYRNGSFYAMRTDALDRFGTRLEHRFTAAQIREMMNDAGLCEVVVGNQFPYWCAVGTRC